jgi:polysaccharide biosynthesis protein PslH
MRLLYLCSSFPYPPHGGGALRVMGLLELAAKAGHEVHLLSMGGPQADSQAPAIQELCQYVQIVPEVQSSKQQRLATLLFSSQADMEKRSWSADFLAALEALLQKYTYDVIHFQSLEMGVYLPYARQWQPGAKLIYDAYNAEADLQRSVYLTERRQPGRWPLALYSRIQWARLSRFEAQLCQSADGVLAVSEADRDLLKAVAGQTPVWVVKNGIRASDYTRQGRPLGLQLQQPSLVFTGIMNYRPNVDAALWFSKRVYPLIDREEATVYWVGDKPAASVQKLARRPGVVVTGKVPEVRPYLHQASVFIVPLRMGSGTRLKLLQAMAAGCAIVSTPIGAQGLNLEHEAELLLASHERDFAAAVRRLLDDKLLWLHLAENAQQYVRQHFDWAAIAPQLWQVYNKLLN